MATKATRASIKLKEALQQYSKKMATRVTVFWMIYRVVSLLIVFLRPDVATSVHHLTEGIDTVMIVNMGVYTGNSATEKVAIAFGKREKLYSTDDEPTKDEDDTEYHDEVEEKDND